MTYSPDADTAAIFSTLIIMGAVGSIVMIGYECLRGKEVEVYAPRFRTSKDLVPPMPSPGIFGWAYAAWSTSDDDLMHAAGMDGYVFVRFLRMASAIGFTCCPALVVLLPTYFTAFGQDAVYGINKFSMANIAPGGDRLWASLLFAYAFTIIFLYYIHKEYENFVTVRRKYFRLGDPTIDPQMTYSIMAENLPANYCSSKKLEEFFEQLFPKEVVCAAIAVSAPALADTVAERRVANAKLENALAMVESDSAAVRPVLNLRKGKPVMFSCLADEKNVDSIDYWRGEVATLSEVIVKIQQEAERADGDAHERISMSSRGDDARQGSAAASFSAKSETPSEKKDKKMKVAVTCTGFVTFNSRRAQSAACQVPVLSDLYPNIVLSQAPAPSDMVWSNMGATTHYTASASTVTSTIYYVGLLFWATILAFVSSVSTIDNLQEFLPFIEDLDTATKAIISAQLPVIMLIVLLAIVPMIMSALSLYVEKRKSYTEVQKIVFSWFFLYLMANVFVITIGGSIFTSLDDALDNPASIINLLGAALPTVAVFFLNYTLTQLLLGIPLLLIRIGPLIITKLYTKCSCIFNPNKITRRALVEGPFAKFSVDYGAVLPPALYLFALTIIYWIIAPLLLAVGSCYFGAAFLTWKYQFLYVVEKRFEGGGRFWYGLYSYSMTILMVSTITFLGFMGIKQATQTPLLLPLPFLVYFAWSYTEGKFKRLSLNFPYSSAVSEDLSKTLEFEKLAVKAEVENEKLHHAASSAESEASAAVSATVVLLGERGGKDMDSGGMGEGSEGDAGKIDESQLQEMIAPPKKHTDSFTVEFLRQEELRAPPTLYPYPFRIGNTPLLNERGALHEVYHMEIPEGVPPSAGYGTYAPPPDQNA